MSRTDRAAKPDSVRSPWRGRHALPADPSGIALADLVDPASLAGIVAGHLRDADVDVLGEARITYVRYKPTVGAQIALELSLRSGDQIISQTYSLKSFASIADMNARLAKWKTRRTEPPAFGAPVFEVPSHHAVVCAFPNDSALPGLRVLHHAKAVHVLLTDHVLPAGERSRRHKLGIKPIKYKPERRFVARLRVRSRAEAAMERRKRYLFARAYAGDAGERARVATDAVAAKLPFVPRPVGHDAERGVYVQEKRDGKPLADLLDSSAAATHVEHAGARLRELHQAAVELPRANTRTELLAALSADVDGLATIPPDARRARAIRAGATRVHPRAARPDGAHPRRLP